MVYNRIFMGIGLKYNAYLGLLILMGSGCTSYVDVQTPEDEVFRLVKYQNADSTAKALSLIDSVLTLDPIPRYWSDSLAHQDSLAIVNLMDMRTSILYHTGEKTAAVHSFMETIPWTPAWPPRGQATFWKFYSHDMGEAITLTQSPNLARLAYKAYTHAEVVAYETGNLDFYKEVLGSRMALADSLALLPDSVRLAFAPAPPSSTNNPWTFAAVALVLGFIVGGGSWQFYRKQKRQQAKTEGTQTPSGSTEDILDALWMICNDINAVPDEVVTIVKQTCRKTTSQRAMFLQAGLIARVYDLEAPPLNVANTVRSRLLRYFKSRGWKMNPGVRLPRDREEWYLWFSQMEMVNRKPSIALQTDRTSSAVQPSD